MAASVFLAAAVHGLVARVLLADLAELLMLIGRQVRVGIEMILERLLDVEKFLPVMWVDFTLPSRSTNAKMVFCLRLPG